MQTTPNLFEALAHHVEIRWSKTSYDLEAFPSIATQALRDFNYQLTQEQLDQVLANWLGRSKGIPDQINLHNTFGQPPITVFNNERFVVDIYIWLGCDTSIHSHGFRGAFKVLHGSSLHETFKVTTTEKIADDVELTDLGVPHLELLGPQDIRTISPGRNLTHRVIHLAEPTVTLCVKTINEKSLSQWHHFISPSVTTNNLAIRKRHLDPALIKQVYYFQYLMRQNGMLAETFLSQLLDRTDISTQMNLCEEVAGGGYDLSDEVAQFLLETVYDRHSKTEWFRRYEQASETQASWILFDRCPSPVLRLAAHFANTERPFDDVASMLNRLAGKTVSKKEIESSIISWIESENPEAQPQIERVRTFLAD